MDFFMKHQSYKNLKINLNQKKYIIQFYKVALI